MRGNKEISIFLITRRFYPLIGGTEKNAERLAQKLITKGINVTVITSRVEKHWEKEEYLGKLRVVRLSSPSIRIWGTFIYLLNLVFYLFSNRCNYQVIHVHHVHYEAFLGAFLGNILKKKTVFKLASGEKYGKIMGDLFQLNNSFGGRSKIFGIKKANKLIATTSQIKNHLLEFGFSNQKILLIPDGTDIETFRPRNLREHGSEPRQCKKVIFVGRLSEEKGVISLIKAWRNVLDWYDKGGQIILEIMGDGPQRMECLKLVRDIGLIESVRFMGNVNNVQDYLIEGDVFVLPSFFEGLSNALLEAMACALPIVATRVSGNIEVIEDGFNGLLVEPGDPLKMAEKILLLLKEKELALGLGQNARMTVEDRFSLDKVADDYIKLYNELLMSKGQATRDA